MLSVLLGCAFISRQFWGAFADRHGGLKTVLAGSAFQTIAVGGFLLTQNEAGLFIVAAGYGSASPASFRPMSWRSATCFPPSKRRGASRWCCSRQ